MIRLLAITLLLIALPCYAQWQYNDDGTQSHWNTMPNGTQWQQTDTGTSYIYPQKDYTQTMPTYSQPQQIDPVRINAPRIRTYSNSNGY